MPGCFPGGGRDSGKAQPGMAWLYPVQRPGRADDPPAYSPMTSTPLAGVKLKVPEAKLGLRFQPVKLITVR